MPWLLLLALASPSVEAKPKRSSSGASRMEAGQFAECVQEAVLGRSDTECVAQPEKDICVGLRKALEYSQLQTECRRQREGRCVYWGHLGLSQDLWISTAAGHLAQLGSCVRRRYGGDDSNGLAQARADSALIDWLRQLDDGSSAIGLEPNTVIRRALEEDSFAAIVGDSLYAKKQDSLRLATIKQAAETPLPIPETPRSEISESAIRRLAADTAAQRFIASQEAAVPSSAEEESRKLLPSKPRLLIEPTTTKANVMGTGHRPPRRFRSPYSLGLDLTLFERITEAYGRHAATLQGIDQYVRQPAARARDYRELLQRGESL